MSRSSSVVPASTRTFKLPPLESIHGSVSEYKNEYIKHSLISTKAIKPNDESIMSKDTLEDVTTNRTDYIAYEQCKPKSFKKLDKYVIPDEKMEKDTCYKVDFEKKAIEKRKPFKVVRETVNIDRFEGTPTYKKDFIEWPLSKQRVPQKIEYVKPAQSFSGSPTYKTDFIHYKEGCQPRRLIKPAENSMSSNDPFDNRTGYRSDFVRHSLPVKFRRVHKEWEPAKEAFICDTNYTSDFKEKIYSKRDNFKPISNTETVDETFNGITTQREDYKTWKLENRKIPDIIQYKKPEEPMMSMTTNLSDFGPKPYSKVSPIHRTQEKEILGKFDNSTNYSHDFQKPNMSERAKPKPKKEYEPPQDSFSGVPTYTLDFIEHKGGKREPIKPSSNQSHDNSEFEGTTTYRVDYNQRAGYGKNAMTQDELREKPKIWYEPISHRPFLSFNENQVIEQKA